MVSKAEPARRARAPGPLRLAFSRAVEDWYYGLIPFAALNFVYWRLLFEPAHFIMERKMMLGIKQRAERAFAASKEMMASPVI